MPVSKFLFGTGFENEIRVGFPLMDFVHDREDGEGSEYIDVPDGSIDTWRQNKMFTMQAEARWIPDGPGTNPVQTQLSGPVSWEEFVNWARDGRVLRFVPDETVPDFYVDNTYLVEPRKGFGSLSTDIKRNVPLKLRNPAKSFHEAMRGIMFEYAPQTGLIDPLAYAFTRASAATRRGLPGSLASAIGASELANVLRDRHYEGALKTALVEAGRTQLLADPENFGNWSISEGTPVRTAGQADPFGGTAAYKLSDDNAASLERIQEAMVFSLDGEKCIALFLRQGTSPVNKFGLSDLTAGVVRHRVNVTWTAGVPVLTTDQGSGTRFTPINWGAGWWLCAISVVGVIASPNTNVFVINATTDTASDTGDVFIFGANAWNATFPSSYQGPATSVRPGDVFTAPFPYTPQAMFMLLDQIEGGEFLSASSGSIFDLSIGTNATNHVAIYRSGSPNDIRPAVRYQGTSLVTSAGCPAIAIGDRLQTLVILNADGTLLGKNRINSGAEVAGVLSGSGGALPAAWNAATLGIGAQSNGSNPGYQRIVRVKIGPLSMGGVARDTIAKALAA